MTASEAVLVLAVLGAAAALGTLVYLAREQLIPRVWLRFLTVICAVALVLMLLSDWPFEALADFWADHSVVSGLLSTILLVALGFLAFEDSERRRQERLDSGLTAAGLSGVVDHLVDVEVVLSLLSRESPPSYDGWEAWCDPAGKPLRWLRHRRERLFVSSESWPAEDPRLLEATLPSLGGTQTWRSQLIDQAVRRLSAALRDWSPVIGVSRNGRVMLVAIASVRKDLMRLSNDLDHGRVDHGAQLLLALRLRCRLLAYYFERQSESYPPRPEILSSFVPLSTPNGKASLLGADQSGLSREWRQALEVARAELESPA